MCRWFRTFTQTKIAFTTWILPNHFLLHDPFPLFVYESCAVVVSHPNPLMFFRLFVGSRCCLGRCSLHREVVSATVLPGISPKIPQHNESFTRVTRRRTLFAVLLVQRGLQKKNVKRRARVFVAFRLTIVVVFPLLCRLTRLQDNQTL